LKEVSDKKHDRKEGNKLEEEHSRVSVSPREYKGEIVISFEIEGHDYEDRCGTVTNNVPEFNKPKRLVP